MKDLKKSVLSALESNSINAVVSLARRERKVLSLLVRIAYDKETLAGWRAIKAIGLAARELVKTDPDFLRETCRKLLWSLTDESGGIGWSAPEILGEIVSADPKRFLDIIPLIASAYEVEEDVFRPGVVYAFARIAEQGPELVLPYQKITILSLTDKDPHVKINGLELVRKLWPRACETGAWSLEYRGRIRTVIDDLRKDKGEAWVYKGDDFASIQTCEEAARLIKILV